MLSFEPLLDSTVLVLNRLYQPVRVTHARRAFAMLARGAAQAVDASGESYDFGAWSCLPVLDHHDCIRTVSLVLRIPRVLRLVRYDRAPRSVVRLSSRNVMVRDRFQCQYCGAVLPAEALSIDHVIPRSQRGPAAWDNLVACCHPCNVRKGGRTPEQAGMKLLRTPSRPRWCGLQDLFAFGTHPFEEWKPFLR